MTPEAMIADLEEQLETKRKLIKAREIDTLRLSAEVEELKQENALLKASANPEPAGCGFTTT